jgi:hypothetical protein
LIATQALFPGSREQHDVAGRHYLTKAEINALYFATHAMGRPRGWDAPLPIDRYWRATLAVFFNLRGGHRDGLGIDAGPRADPLAARLVGRRASGR